MWREGVQEKISKWRKQVDFFSLQMWEEGAMNLVQDLSLDNLLSIRRLRIRMRIVKRKDKLIQHREGGQRLFGEFYKFRRLQPSLSMIIVMRIQLMMRIRVLE